MTQVCPLFMKVMNCRLGMMSSMSTSSSNIAADLPPSSSVTGRSSPAQTLAIERPVSVEPVKATLSTPGCETKYAPTSDPPGTQLMTPGGTPAASAASATMNQSNTVAGGDGFTTTEHPAARAGAILLIASTTG